MGKSVRCYRHCQLKEGEKKKRKKGVGSVVGRAEGHPEPGSPGAALGSHGYHRQGCCKWVRAGGAGRDKGNWGPGRRAWGTHCDACASPHRRISLCFGRIRAHPAEPGTPRGSALLTPQDAQRPAATRSPEGAGGRQRGPMGAELRRGGRGLALRRANEIRASGAARNRRLRPSAAGGLGRAAGRAMEESGAEPGLRRFTWEEIAQRTGRGPAAEERWLVIDRKVYDISRFHRRHPGGSRVISHYAGQDATVRGRGAGEGWGVSAAGMERDTGRFVGFRYCLSAARCKEKPLFSVRKCKKNKRGGKKRQTKEDKSTALRVLSAAVAPWALVVRGGRPSAPRFAPRCCWPLV